MFAVTGGEHFIGSFQIGNGGTATLADKVECQYIRAQTETFYSIAGQAGTQVTSAGADKDGVNFAGIYFTLGEGAFGSDDCERRGMFDKPLVERIGIDGESFLQIIEGKMTRGDSVFPIQNFLENGLGTGIEGLVSRTILNYPPAICLGITLRRIGRADSNDKHV